MPKFPRFIIPSSSWQLFYLPVLFRWQQILLRHQGRNYQLPNRSTQTVATSPVYPIVPPDLVNGAKTL